MVLVVVVLQMEEEEAVSKARSDRIVSTPSTGGIRRNSRRVFMRVPSIISVGVIL